MGEILETTLTVCAFAAVGLLLLLIVGFYAVAVYKGGAKIVRALCRKRCALCLAAVAVVAIIHGGAKNIVNRFSSDEGITVTAAEINVATNDTDATTLVYAYAGTNDVALPLYVRQSVSNEWEHLGAEWNLDGRTYADGTNTVVWSVQPPASNIVPFVMYYVGDNPPPVEIEESGGVEIVAFTMSSKSVSITYAVDGAMLRGGVGVVSIERSERANVWENFYTTNHVATATNTVTGAGFWIDRTTRWRVRMEVGQ